MNLFFYDVNTEYINYLKSIEIAKRGFTRVPDIEYKNKKKMVCGVVLEINDFKYYVPISSYKIQQKNNILIRLNDDKFNPIKGSLRFNYMFPIADEYITQRDFSKETPGRAEFLRRQWIYCNSIEKEIADMAQNTYNSVINNHDLSLIHASCDFKLLEEACRNYSEIKNEDFTNN